MCIYMYAYIYIYVCIYLHMHVCIYTYIHVTPVLFHIRTYLHVYMYTYMYIYICIYLTFVLYIPVCMIRYALSHVASPCLDTRMLTPDQPFPPPPLRAPRPKTGVEDQGSHVPFEHPRETRVQASYKRAQELTIGSQVALILIRTRLSLQGRFKQFAWLSFRGGV